MEASRQPKRRRLVESSLEDLPDDLVAEILIRISDYKCLFQCKSVCKLWSSLISKTDFGRRYITLHPSMNNMLKNLPITFIGNSSGNPKTQFSIEPIFQYPCFSFNFLPFSPRIWILETFNDLVLFCDSRNFQRQLVYYICNPLTRQWTVLPPAPSTDFLDRRVSFIGKDDPMCGTAFEVVRILQTMPFSNVICLQIFSTKTGQWNQTILTLPQNLALLMILEAAICNNGKKLVLLGLNVEPRGVVSITIEGEKFDQYGITNLPSVDLLSRDMNGFTLCKRNLRMAHLDWLHILQIWKLRGSGEWKLVQSEFIYDHIIELLPEYYKTNPDPNPFALGFHPHDRNVLYINLNFNGRLASYDMGRRTLKIVPNVCLDNFQGTVYPFVLPFWPTPVGNR